MSILDSLSNSQVDVCKSCFKGLGYVILKDKNIYMLEISKDTGDYDVWISYTFAFELDNLVRFCENDGKRLLEDISYHPNIIEVSPLYIIEAERNVNFSDNKYDLAVGIKVDVHTAYSSIRLIWSLCTFFWNYLRLHQTISFHWINLHGVNKKNYSYSAARFEVSLMRDFYNYLHSSDRSMNSDWSRCVSHLLGRMLSNKEQERVRELCCDWYIHTDPRKWKYISERVRSQLKKMI